MEHELEILVTWENGIGFRVTAKCDENPDPVTVIEADENGCIGDLWKHYQKAIELFIKLRLEHVGSEMMSQE